MKTKKIKIILCFVLTAISVFSEFVVAASFDCSLNTLTIVESVICSDQQLSHLDDQIAIAYHSAMANTSNKIMLRNQQRAWLRQRNQCNDLRCLKNIYMRRLAELSDFQNTLRQRQLEEQRQRELQAEKQRQKRQRPHVQQRDDYKRRLCNCCGLGVSTCCIQVFWDCSKYGLSKQSSERARKQADEDRKKMNEAVRKSLGFD
jgi:uncharacterized protein